MIRYIDLVEDTICSPLTPPGYSGVAVIRVSGDKSLDLTLSRTKLKKEKIKSHSVYLTHFLNQDDSPIDQVLVTYFEKGRSFTGDECVEVSCHGNPLIINKIIQQYLSLGVRTAERGEFSFRAYYNGQIDLVQAESIHELVKTKFSKGSETYVNQLGGKLSETIKELENKIITCLAHLEVTVDFIEQDVDSSDYKDLELQIKSINNEVERLCLSYHVGKNLQREPEVLLLGPTNAGKSSIFNQLIEEDRSIVTNIEGTTRDIVSERKFIGHNNINFLDSAGIRETFDPIESKGIEKTREAREKANIILFVVDASNPSSLDELNNLPKEKTVIVFNKMDLVNDKVLVKDLKSLIVSKTQWKVSDHQFIELSAMQGQGFDQLTQSIEMLLVGDDKNQPEQLVTQARHFDHLTNMKLHLDKVQELLSNIESPEFIVQELQLVLMEVHQVLGKEYDDEVLDKVFSQFCIGK